MQTPWFLELLALGTDADERAIKRAYAVLLKQIDPAADPAGFARLREAYEHARTWVSQPPAPLITPATEPAVAPEVAPAPAPFGDGPAHAAPELDAAPSPAPAPEPVIDFSPLPPPATAQRPAMHDPSGSAERVMERFARRVKYGNALDVTTELDACAAELRKSHMDAPILFERLLLDALVRATLRKRAQVFAAAYDYFGWREYMHLASLGPAGGWVDHVERERQAFRATATLARNDLIQWLSKYGEGTTPIPDHIAREWPRVRDALAQYRYFLGLYISDAGRAAWSSRCEEATGSAQAAATNEAERMRQFKANRTRHEPGSSRSNHRLAVVLFLSIIGVLSRILAPPSATDADARSRTPAVRHVPGRNEAERMQAYECMRSIDQLSAPGTQLTAGQATELRECRLRLDQITRAEGNPH